MTYPAMILCPYTAPADTLNHPDGAHRCIQQVPVGGDHLGEHTCGCGAAFVGTNPPEPPEQRFRPEPTPDYPHDGSDPAGAATAGGAGGSGTVVYLIWSQSYNAWWGPAAWGYTESIQDAGRFTEAEAVAYTVSSAASGIRDQVSFLVAAPDNWAGPLPEPAGGWAEHDQAAVRESQEPS